MSLSFKGKVVLVTGAASGIGAAAAQAFSRAGARVVAADVRSCAQTMDDLSISGGEAEACDLDVTDAPAVEAALDGIRARFGGLHHVVNCAGLATRHTLAQMPVETWRQVIDVNLTGSFILLKSAERHLADSGGGSITLISSVAAKHVAFLSGAHYAASKTAQLGLVRQAAFELGRHGIRVNAIGPGHMTNRMGGGRHPPDALDAAARKMPLQRVVEPEDVADACLFLASPMARVITGIYLPVDAGFLTARGQSPHAYFEAHEAVF